MHHGCAAHQLIKIQSVKNWKDSLGGFSEDEHVVLAAPLNGHVGKENRDYIMCIMAWRLQFWFQKCRRGGTY